MYRRSTLASLLVVALVASYAAAGPVWVNLVIDPVSDADAGGTLDGTSSHSGPLRWHLYALDDTPGSLGIHNFNVTMININQVLNRSPSTVWDDDNDPDSGTFDAGFVLARSVGDTTLPLGPASNPITGSQPAPGTGHIITGFGRTASDFTAAIPGASNFGPQTSRSWGDYATDPLTTGSSGGNNWLFLAEGQYAAGSPPSIGNMRFQLLTAVNNDNGTATIIEATEQIGAPILPINTPPTIVNYEEMVPLNASDPGFYQHQMTAIDTDLPPQTLTWSDLSLVAYTPNYGGMGSGPATMPTISSTGLFEWDTVSSSRGDYVFSMTVSDGAGGSDVGTITLHILQVPEPATLALFAMAMVGALGLTRRRNAGR